MFQSSLSKASSRLLLSLEIGLLAACAALSPAKAANKTFLVASDGYGIDDCLATQSACGKMVADAWCTAHGLPKALAFGSASVTGSIGDSAKATRDAVLVTCGD